MNRAERRQAMRASGNRGAKARRVRTDPPAVPPEVVQAFADQADHDHRQMARRMGLVVPPSAGEARTLRAGGRSIGAGGLLLPPGV